MARVKNYRPEDRFSLKARRVLGHWAGATARSIVAPLHALTHHRENFRPGISANIVTRNDPWFPESVASIREYVQEFVIVDSSTAPYHERNERLLDAWKLPDLVYRHEPLDIFEARRLASSLTTRSWALRWDADIVATQRISELFRLLEGLPAHRYYYEVFFPLLNVASTLDRVSTQTYQVEAWLYSSSRKFSHQLRHLYTGEPGQTDEPHVPLFYRKLYLNEVYGIHLARFMPTAKLVEKRLHFLWMTPDMKQRYTDYETFYRAMRPTAEATIRDEPTIPYDETQFGPLPRELAPYRGRSPEEIFPEPPEPSGA
ncbi:MAG: hypothetical protein WCA77_06150 [Thermoplasmata archaeon]